MIKDQKKWDNFVKINSDPYGGACINIARRVMELLDEVKEFDANDLVTQANKELDEGITGFMAGATASVVSQCHSRGDEFMASWNQHTQIKDEGDKATAEGKTLNPALIVIEEKK